MKLTKKEFNRRKALPAWQPSLASCELCGKPDPFQRGDLLWVCIVCYWSGEVPLSLMEYQENELDIWILMRS